MKGSAYLDAGRAAVESGSLNEQIEADMQFHGFINELAGNPLIGETTAPHWPYLRRVMGEVLRDDAQMPQTILAEHVAILDAIIAGDAARAETAQPRSYFKGCKDLRAAAAGTAGGFPGRNAAAPPSTHPMR